MSRSMSLMTLARSRLFGQKPWKISGARSLHGLPPKNEYTDVAKYPEIPKNVDPDEVGKDNLVETIKGLRTVEEKLYYLNKPKYYGWYSSVIDLNKIFYGSLDYVQYATWTHIVNGLPDTYNRFEEQAQRLADELTPALNRLVQQDLPLMCHENEAQNEKIFKKEPFALPMAENVFKVHHDRANRLVGRVDRLIQMHLAPNMPHLLTAQVDKNFRSEAFWFRGGFEPDKSMLKKRLGTQQLRKQKPYVYKYGLMTDEQVYKKKEACIQTIGKGMLQIRNEQALKANVSMDDELCRQAKMIPEFRYDPRTLGYRSTTQTGVNTPGFWTCSKNGFTTLQFISSINNAENLTSETSRKEEYNERDDMLLVKAILGSFSVLLPEACHLGFTPFNDPSQPLTTQTIVTDGRKFKPAVYQLNKSALFRDDTSEECINNICWHAPEIDLFVPAENESGLWQVNKAGLVDLLKLYLNAPSVQIEREAETIFDVKNSYNRQYFNHQFRNVFSRRPPPRPKPDIQAFEKLFMIDHNLFSHRGLREQPWFKMAKIDYMGKEHWHPEFRPIDYYEPKYIPRATRKESKNPREKLLKKVSAPLPPDHEE